MALITLAEAKNYLRVDTTDDDALIAGQLLAAERMSVDVGRLTEDEWAEVDGTPAADDAASLVALRATIRMAALYALGYLYEHRDEADHHDLTMTLRALLFAVREGR